MTLIKLSKKAQSANYKLIVHEKETLFLALYEAIETMAATGVKEEELALGLSAMSLRGHNKAIFGDVNKTFMYTKK